MWGPTHPECLFCASRLLTPPFCAQTLGSSYLSSVWGDCLPLCGFPSSSLTSFLCLPNTTCFNTNSVEESTLSVLLPVESQSSVFPSRCCYTPRSLQTSQAVSTCNDSGCLSPAMAVWLVSYSLGARLHKSVFLESKKYIVANLEAFLCVLRR